MAHSPPSFLARYSPPSSPINPSISPRAPKRVTQRKRPRSRSPTSPGPGRNVHPSSSPRRIPSPSQLGASLPASSCPTPNQPTSTTPPGIAVPPAPTFHSPRSISPLASSPLSSPSASPRLASRAESSDSFTLNLTLQEEALAASSNLSSSPSTPTGPSSLTNLNSSNTATPTTIKPSTSTTSITSSTSSTSIPVYSNLSASLVSPISGTSKRRINASMDPINFEKQMMRWFSLRQYPHQIISEIEMLRKCFLKSKIRGGDIIAVRISALPPSYREWLTNSIWQHKADFNPSFFLCRAASVPQNPDFVEFFLDPLETITLSVHTHDVMIFKKEGLKVIEGMSKRERIFFTEPLFFFFRPYIDLIVSEVADYLYENNSCPREDRDTKAINKIGMMVSSLEELEKANQATGPVQFQELVVKLNGLFERFNVVWLKAAPSALFCSTLQTVKNEIDLFVSRIPSLVGSELDNQLQSARQNVSDAKLRIRNIVKGITKRETCDWWLSHISQQVDSFLELRGYNKMCLPADYMDRRPLRLDLVKENRDLLMMLMKGEVSDCIDTIVDEVYEVLDPLILDLEFVLEGGWKEWVKGVEFGEKELSALKIDYTYLKQVKKMDKEIGNQKKEKGLQRQTLKMSDVVPVSGLVMARFQIYVMECETALEIWSSRPARGTMPLPVSTSSPSISPPVSASGAMFPVSNSFSSSASTSPPDSIPRNPSTSPRPPSDLSAPSPSPPSEAPLSTSPLPPPLVSPTPSPSVSPTSSSPPVPLPCSPPSSPLPPELSSPPPSLVPSPTSPTMSSRRSSRRTAPSSHRPTSARMSDAPPPPPSSPPLSPLSNPKDSLSSLPPGLPDSISSPKSQSKQPPSGRKTVRGFWGDEFFGFLDERSKKWDEKKEKGEEEKDKRKPKEKKGKEGEGEGGGEKEERWEEEGVSSSSSGARNFLDSYNSLCATQYDHQGEDDELSNTNGSKKLSTSKAYQFTRSESDGSLLGKSAGKGGENTSSDEEEGMYITGIVVNP